MYVSDNMNCFIHYVMEDTLYELYEIIEVGDHWAYECKICGSVFTQKRNVLRHLKNSHPQSMSSITKRSHASDDRHASDSRHASKKSVSSIRKSTCTESTVRFPSSSAGKRDRPLPPPMVQVPEMRVAGASSSATSLLELAEPLVQLFPPEYHPSERMADPGNNGSNGQELDHEATAQRDAPVLRDEATMGDTPVTQ